MANLLLASRLGDLSKVKSFLGNGISVNIRDDYGRTPLYKAAQHAHLQCVEYLIQEGAEIDSAEDVYGRTPLMISSKNGHTDIVTKLIEHKASLDRADNDGMTSLFHATRNSRLETVRHLLEQNPNKEIKENCKGRTVILEASAVGNADIVELLLQSGVGVNKRDTENNTALILASKNNHFNIVKLLLKYHADIDSINSSDCSALAWGVMTENYDIVQELVEQGCDIESLANENNTPLGIASKERNEKIVSYLIEHGANVNSQNDYFQSPLSIAAIYGNCKIISILLENGANVNQGAQHNESPLHNAAESGCTEAVSLLLNAGADVTFSEFTNVTIWGEIFSNEYNRNLEVVSLLLDAGCDPEMCKDDGNTALHLAFFCSYEDVIELLLSKGANVNAINKEGEAPLMYACNKASIQTISLLLQHGATVNSVSKEGLSAIRFARNKERVQLLIKSGADIELKHDKGQTPLLLACVHAISGLKRSCSQSYYYDSDTEEEVVIEESKISSECAAEFDEALEVVKTLLDCGANVNACTSAGDTCLHLSIAPGGDGYVPRLVNLLLTYKPLILRNKDNKTPLQVAEDNSRDDIVTILSEYVESSNYPISDKEQRYDFKDALSFEAAAKDNKNLHSRMKLKTDKIIASDIADALKHISNNPSQEADPEVEMIKTTLIQDLSDKHLLRIAKKLKEDWKLVAGFLGVSRTTIKQITRESEGDTYAAWDMLIHWRDGATGTLSDKRGVLKEAMVEAEKSDIVDII